jgi:hypothetical protein
MLLFLSCTNVSRDVKQNLCFLDKFSQKIEKISLKEIDKIKKLNGQFIQVEGYLTYEFENVALYPYKWSESDKSLWLNFSDNIFKNEEELITINYKEVTVIGKVNILHKGHYSGYLAELDSVFCIKEK